MEDRRDSAGWPVLLEILGQAERINFLYTHITLCFPTRVDRPSSREEITDNLQWGLARLGQGFPWISGKVVKEDDGFKIIAAETGLGLVLKDLHDDATVPTWNELSQAKFPFRMLDEDVFAPCKTMVEPNTERPVLLVQASFVKGGLLLTFGAQHGSMDMAGLGQVITLIARACSDEAFTRDEIANGNMTRIDRIPLADDQKPHLSERLDHRPGGEEKGLEASTRGSIKAPPSTPSDDVQLEWAYLEFPAASLSGLKSLASQALTGDTAFVSTDDVLTAFIWQSISRARQPRLDGLRSTPTTLTRNVDSRGCFGLPPAYPGLMVTATSHTHPVDRLAGKSPLGAIASELRMALDPVSIRKIAIAQAKAITRKESGAGQRGTAVSGNPSLDVRLSSWAKEKLCHLDFGPCLGKPEVVRRPRFIKGAREGLVYFLPKTREGEIIVGMCLRKEDMGCLKSDIEVCQWSSWIA